MNAKTKIVVNCAPRIIPALQKELQQLGFTSKVTSKQGVELRGDFRDAMYLNLHLRSAVRVLYLIKDFQAVKPDHLYKALYQIDWSKYIASNGYISVDGYARNDYINDTRFANLKVKDAIVDKVYSQKGRRPDSGPKSDKTCIFLHWINDRASIYINTSGETIGKHGYRKLPFKAPMMEYLAAATIITSEWDRKSHFINPMCGSGTLAIEAALLATNTAPGLLRENFGFMHVKIYDPLEWKLLVTEAKAKIKRRTNFKIVASDRSNLALEAAKKNAEHAGMTKYIDFQKCDFADTKVPEEQSGVVFFNPEYGDRLGEEKELVEVYKGIGDFFKKKCKGYFGYIFTGNLSLGKQVGLRTKRKVEFYNGKIDARLLEYELYAGSKKTIEK